MKKIVITDLQPELQQILEMNNLSDQMLKSLNEILMTEGKTKEDINNAISIAYHILKGYIGKCTRIENIENALHNFSMFYQRKLVDYDAEQFSIALANILAEIKKQEEEGLADRDREEQEILIQKINTAFLLGSNREGFSYKDLYKYMLKIIGMKQMVSERFGDLSLDNLYILSRVIERKDLNWGLYNEQYFFDVILSESVSFYLSDRECDFEDKVFDALEKILSAHLDKEHFEKAIKIIIKNFQAYIFFNAINNPNMTKEKLEYMIDYYTTIFARYSQEGSVVNKDTALSVAETPIYSVPYSKRLLAMSDGKYCEELDNILYCNKPHSYSTVVADSNLEGTKRKLALLTIKQGDTFPVVPEEVENYEDYKHYVAKAVLTPALQSLDTKDYMEILVIINSMCEIMKKRTGDAKNLINKKLNNILFLLQSSDPTVKSFNVERLKKSIYELKNPSDSANINELITQFCSHLYSRYYTDSEYDNIINLIREAKSYEKSRILVRMFLSTNLPYMEDKSELFLMALRPISLIQEYLKLLEERGKANRNQHSILDGINESTLNAITGDNNGIGEQPNGKSAK